MKTLWPSTYTHAQTEAGPGCLEEFQLQPSSEAPGGVSLIWERETQRTASSINLTFTRYMPMPWGDGLVCWPKSHRPLVIIRDRQAVHCQEPAIQRYFSNILQTFAESEASPITGRLDQCLWLVTHRSKPSRTYSVRSPSAKPPLDWLPDSWPGALRAEIFRGLIQTFGYDALYLRKDWNELLTREFPDVRDLGTHLVINPERTMALPLRPWRFGQ